MSRPEPPAYRTPSWHDHDAALARRGSLSIWFDPETQWLAEATGTRGRQPVFSDAAIQTCLTLKALFGLPPRQTTGMAASLLDLAGLDWPVPDFSTLSRRQTHLTVLIPYRPSRGALHLLIDSTGIKAEGDGEWFAKKHGPSRPREWRKMHLGIDADTLEIRAIEITGSRIGDPPLLPDLLHQIPDDQPIERVTADGAYDTRACHAASAERGAAAVIPPRKNGKPWKEQTAGATARNEALRSCRHLGRAIRRRWTGYHQRRPVAAKMHRFKLLALLWWSFADLIISGFTGGVLSDSEGASFEGGWRFMGNWRSDLETWLAPFVAALGHKTRGRMCPAYIAGLIGPGDRKSVQPMAARDGAVGYDQLHHFIADGVWDSAPLEAALLAEADRLVGGEEAFLVIDDTCLPKKGERSVGVAPQYASSLGKTANCQSLVSVTLASREVPVAVG